MSSNHVLRSGYDLLLVDLDGTLFRGDTPIAGAAEALAAGPQRVVYATNNASRSAAEVAAHLSDMGFTAVAADVVTSAQVGARLVAGQVEPGSPVLVVGTDSLAAEVESVGLRPVRDARQRPVAVIQGHSPQTCWSNLAEAAYALAAGAKWIATNTDLTVPNERGLGPGNGSMVAALRAATGREPEVAGKPFPPLFTEVLAALDVDPARALVVGDRLDTDIEGANRSGLRSLLVRTGVDADTDLSAVPPGRRPTYVGDTLSALNSPPIPPE